MSLELSSLPRFLSATSSLDDELDDELDDDELDDDELDDDELDDDELDGGVGAFFAFLLFLSFTALASRFFPSFGASGALTPSFFARVSAMGVVSFTTASFPRCRSACEREKENARGESTRTTRVAAARAVDASGGADDDGGRASRKTYGESTGDLSESALIAKRLRHGASNAAL